jgi:type IV pilus assembly protein PilV
VLVALLVVSLGVMAMLGLLGTASRLGKTSEFRATATLLAQDIADRLRANLDGAREGSYDVSPAVLAESRPAAAAECIKSEECTATEIAAIDLAQWRAELFNSLPGGTGYLRYAADAADVWIVWRDPSVLADDGDKKAIFSDAERAEVCPPDFPLTDPIPTCMYFRVAR